ncbi:MAG: hypothetical protein IJD37_00740, partial [Clostridia bacterium]|nr:hypothetical protein [Clostridia bacterium]
MDPKTFCATKGDNTLLENAYIEATVTSDDVLVLQLTDAQMNSWKNAVVHLQILQSILGEDKEIVSKVIPPADPFYKSLYEDAVNCGF